jgi:hypothetical protein
MTGDPRRIAGAHTIDRVTLRRDGRAGRRRRQGDARKAAELARATARRTWSRGCAANFGTTIDEGTRPIDPAGHRHHVAARRHVLPRHPGADRRSRGAPRSTSSVPADRRARRLGRHDQRQRRRRLSSSVDERHARTVRPSWPTSTWRCACAALREDLDRGRRDARHVGRHVPGRQARSTPGIEIIHSTDSNITISVLVPEEDVARAEQAIHDYFRLGRGQDATPPEMAWSTRATTGWSSAARPANRRRSPTRKARALLEAVKDEVGERAGVVAGTGSNNTRTFDRVHEAKPKRPASTRRSSSFRTTASRRRTACCALRCRSHEATALPIVVYNIPSAHRRQHAAGRRCSNSRGATQHRGRQRIERRLRAVQRDPARPAEGFGFSGRRRSHVLAVAGARRRRPRRRRLAPLRARAARAARAYRAGDVARAGSIHRALRRCSPRCLRRRRRFRSSGR